MCITYVHRQVEEHKIDLYVLRLRPILEERNDLCSSVRLES
jgi:hypothetical protein